MEIIIANILNKHFKEFKTNVYRDLQLYLQSNDEIINKIKDIGDKNLNTKEIRIFNVIKTTKNWRELSYRQLASLAGLDSTKKTIRSTIHYYLKKHKLLKK